MDVLPTVGGSWLGLDSSMSARVQLAVNGSCLKLGDAVGLCSGCTGVHGTPPRGGTLVK